MIIWKTTEMQALNIRFSANLFNFYLSNLADNKLNYLPDNFGISSSFASPTGFDGNCLIGIYKQ